MPKVIFQPPHFLSEPLWDASANHQIFTNASRMRMFSIKVGPIHLKELGLYLHVSGELYTEENNNWCITVPRLFTYNSFSCHLQSTEGRRGAYLLLSEVCELCSVCGAATCGHRLICIVYSPDFLVITKKMIHVFIYN